MFPILMTIEGKKNGQWTVPNQSGSPNFVVLTSVPRQLPLRHVYSGLKKK